MQQVKGNPEDAALDSARPRVDGRGFAEAQSRRDFLRRAGIGSAAALAMVACGKEAATSLVAPLTPPPNLATSGPNGSVILDFSKDIDVLNYAYALEQLEAAFYIMVVGNAAFTGGSIFAANEKLVLNDLRDHEVAHRDFFAAALMTAAIPNLTVNFSSVNFGDRTSVLTTAKTFEDLGVSAYNGAAKYLASADYLTVAGKIVSVEARHASAIRSLLNPRSGDFAPNAFDAPMAPSDVLRAAGPFINQTITVINA